MLDTLFGQDSAFKAQLQMVNGFTTKLDGKTWRLNLRDSIKFRDGSIVLARNYVAAFGQALMAATDDFPPLTTPQSGFGSSTRSHCCWIP